MSNILVINKDTYAEDSIAICKWVIYIFGIKIATIRHTTTEWNVVNKLIIKKNKSINIKSFNNEN